MICKLGQIFNYNTIFLTVIFLKSLEMSSAAARHSIQIYHFISSAMLEFRCHLRQGLVFLCIQDWNCFYILNLPLEKMSQEISSTIKWLYISLYPCYLCFYIMLGQLHFQMFWTFLKLIKFFSRYLLFFRVGHIIIGELNIFVFKGTDIL